MIIGGGYQFYTIFVRFPTVDSRTTVTRQLYVFNDYIRC